MINYEPVFFTGFSFVKLFMESFSYYRFLTYKGEPCIIQNKNDYHTRIKCRGSSFVVENTDLKPLDKPLLVITFYKNLEVKVLKETKFSCIILFKDKVLEVNKKQLNHIFCNINKDLIPYYIDNYGICFTNVLN